MQARMLRCGCVLVWAAAACAAGGQMASRRLEHYRLWAGPFRVPSVHDNLSGIAWNPATKSLFCILNGPETVVEITPDGKLKSRFTLRQCHDTEGIAVVGPGRLAVIEEARRKLRIVPIPKRGPARNTRGSEEALLIERSVTGNNGLEGVAYDPDGRRFFICREKHPKQLYQVALPPQGLPLAKAVVTKLWTFEQRTINIGDASGLHYDRATGHLIVVSHESRCVLEVTLEGRELGRLRLRGLPQAEGVTFDDAGTLYVVSEPNLLALYRIR